MLQAIRDGSKGVVAKVIVGLIILTFALFGIESIVALGGGEKAPASVNGEEISEFQVAQMANLQKRRLQSQFGESFDPSLIDEKLLKQSAMESLISETLLKQASLNSGVWFSDAQIDKMIVQSPEFQVGGKFDRDQYDLILRSAGFTRSTHRELLRASMATQQTQSAWQLTSFATNLESKSINQLELQQRDFSTVRFTLDAVKKGVTVSEDEILDYFNENQANFMTEESVVVDYIVLDQSKLVGLDVTEEQVEQRYSDMQSEVNAKKEYRAAHILLLAANEVNKESLQVLRKRVSSGEDFASLAKEFSEDDSSKYAGGDLGFSQLTVYENEFSEALRGLSVGEVSDVIETRDGLHLIKLLEVRQPELAALDKLKDSIELELRAEASQALYVERLETLKDEAFSSANVLQPAEVLGLTVQTSKAITRNSNDPIFGLPAVNAALFSELVLNEVANSEVIQFAEGKSLVLHLNTFNESKLKSLEDVKQNIVTLVKLQKAKQEIKRISEEALADLSGAKLNWVRNTGKSRFDQAFDSVILDKAFSLSDAVNSVGLVTLPNGDVVVVRIDAVNRNMASTDLEAPTQKVARGKAYNEYQAYNLGLKERADIER